MRAVLLVLTLAVVVLAAPSYETIFTDYHGQIGIPKATRVKASETAIDFDGSRIAGGAQAAEGEFPFMGGIIATLNTQELSVCGATLLSNSRLVTAAHCWRHGQHQAYIFTVVLGSVFLFSEGQRFLTNRVELHAGYDEATLNNNIAMISIDYVKYDPDIGSANLPPVDGDHVGWPAFVIGYGRQGDDGSISPDQSLSYAHVRVISNEECRQIYGPEIVTDSTICTSGDYGRGICDGDAGGPLQIDRDTLIGVASFHSASSCQAGFPSGYTRVSSYLDWITARLQ